MTIRRVASQLIALTLVIVIAPSTRESSPDELRRLVRAAGMVRPTHGRLSAGFPWAPIEAPERGTSRRGDPQMDIAIAELEIVWRDTGAAWARAGAAVGKLLQGETDEAITWLEETVASDPTPNALSDLSAAYLARGLRLSRGVDIANAVEAAGRATELEPNHLEAEFNLAVALSELGLQLPARAAWERYLTRERDAAWRREGLERLADVSNAERTSDSQTLREQLFDQALPALAERSRDVSAVSMILEELTATNSDTSVVSIGREALAARPEALAGHRLYGIARQFHRRAEYKQAHEHFEAALRELDATRSALADWAALHIATIDYLNNDFDGASMRLDAMASRQDITKSPALLGHVEWIRGMIAVMKGRPAEAFRNYERSAATLSTARERENAAFVRALIAEEYEWLSDPVRAWDARLAALREAPRPGILVSTAASARRNGWLHVAWAIHQESVAQARRRGRVPDLIDALRQMALTSSALGRDTEAAAALHEAEGSLAQADSSVRNKLQAEVNLAIARCGCLPLDRTFAAAGKAIDHYTRINAPTFLPDAYLARAQAHQRAGDAFAARADVERGIDRLEAEAREARLDDATRAVLGRQIRRLSDVLVDIEVAAGNTVAALLAADRARARNLFAPSAQPLEAGQLTPLLQKMPADVEIIFLHQQERALLVWNLTRAASSFAQTAIGERELTQLVRRFARQPDDAEAGKALRRLVLPGNNRASKIIIVADGAAHLIPFAALPGLEHRYLIEESEITHVPNLRWLHAQDGRPGASLRSIAAIANPQFDRQMFPDLAALRGAEREASEVVSHYPVRQVVSGALATADAVAQALRASDVVHFAGHALINDLEPSSSQLVVAGSGSAMTARALASLRGVEAQLVVLAACSAASGFVTKAEGPVGLTRALLAAGAESVVASLWPVDDDASITLFGSFHRRFAASGDAAASLRQGQLALLRSEDARLRNPKHWAGFLAIGGFGPKKQSN